MTRSRRIMIIVAVQLILVGVIIFFPESVKERLFGLALPQPRPVISMETYSSGDVVLDAMNEADLFNRFRFTRAVGALTPQAAILILPDATYAEYWHMDTILSKVSVAGMGVMILDMKDAGEFVPIRSEDGVLRTTKERYILFAEAAVSWLESLGFSEIVLLSMGNGAIPAWKMVNEKPENFTAWVDISGRFPGLTAFSPDFRDVQSLPPFLLFRGAQDERLPDMQMFTGTMASNGVSTRLHVLPDSGRGLVNADGRLDPGLETEVVNELLLWIASLPSNSSDAGQPSSPG